MSVEKKIKLAKNRRKQRVKSRLSISVLPRISIFRSLNHIYAQIIDDSAQQTLVSCSSLELNDVTGDKKNKAKSVGLALAKRALEKGIKAGSFDRGPYLYHGRVKALAEGLREGGFKV